MILAENVRDLAQILVGFTGVGKYRSIEAVATTSHGTIALAGSRQAVTRAAAAGTPVTNLTGAWLAPGFNDCHMHILPYGLALGWADLSPQAQVLDVPNLIQRLRDWRAANPDAKWILGARYDQNRFPDGRHPTRSELDAAFPDLPVWIEQTSQHAGAANSLALQSAGITTESADPPAGTIVRGPNGEPNGVLMESAMGLVQDSMPAPTHSAMVGAILRANKALVANGITSASDLCTGHHGMDAEIAAYTAAAGEGALVRTTLYPHYPLLGAAGGAPDRSEFAASYPSLAAGGGLADPHARVRLGGSKLFSDGALTVRTAALRTPYSDGTGSGMLMYSREELQAYVAASILGGWQTAVHAIGDRAIDEVLNAMTAGAPMPGARHRIEHAMLADARLIERMAAHGICAVLQPEFISRLGDAYVTGLGIERASRLNPAKSLQQAGVPVAFSSDCPIVPGSPLEGIRAAAIRKSPAGVILGEAECISREVGLTHYTEGAAWAVHDESDVGRIATGMRADFVLFSHDPLGPECDAARVTATMTGGEWAFCEPGLNLECTPVAERT